MGPPHLLSWVSKGADVMDNFFYGGMVQRMGRSHWFPCHVYQIQYCLYLCISEASKLVMSYVAAVCGKGQEVNKVKEQLLQSNPVLEGE